MPASPESLPNSPIAIFACWISAGVSLIVSGKTSGAFSNEYSSMGHSPVKQPQLDSLIHLLQQHSRQEGITPTAIPGVDIFKASSTTTPLPVVYQPSLCVLVQGQKRVFVGQDVFVYEAGKFLTVTVDLPLQSQITIASATSPYLLLKMDMDTAVITELLPYTRNGAQHHAADSKGLFVGDIDPACAAAVIRLAELLATPGDIPVLAESFKREVLYRVLCGEHGGLIAQLAMKDSHLQRINKAVQRIKEQFNAPLSVTDLAELAGMSVSSFHTHFKNITGLSPLQYQKSLRLLAARTLMTAEALDAATSAYRVGYESTSQFSREYARMFGNPPARDVSLLKQSKNWQTM